MAKEWTLQEILALSGSYWQSFALQAGVDLGLFTEVDDMTGGGSEAVMPALAAKLFCDERALGILVTALAALGFLERKGEGIVLPEHSRKYLSKKSGEYIGYIIQHHTHISPAWTKLSTAVRRGSPTRVAPSDTDNAGERESFLMGMYNIAMNQAEKVAATFDLSGRKRLLDLGGGPGTYAVFFCLANPGLSATVFDRPTSEVFAGNVVKRFGLEGRVDFHGGDFLLDPLPGGYDVAWLSQVLHGETPQNAARLVDRAAKTVNPGGLVAVQEFFLENDRSGPPQSALFGCNMLAVTQGGQVYTWDEISAMLRDAGAVSVSRLDIALPQGCGILVGQMPGG